MLKTIRTSSGINDENCYDAFLQKRRVKKCRMKLRPHKKWST